ncbi:MAG: hypothetical protein OEM41_10265 [Ignavibacteria bacterium]|nr:hypothetical protein [Ignavibacteria bacterium]
MNNRPDKLLPALYGGIIIGVISAVPFLNWVNCCCCAGVMLGGFLSVLFYKNDLPPSVVLTNGDALQLGALAGLFGAVIGTGVNALFLSLLGNISGESLAEILHGFEGVIPPEAFDGLEEGILHADRIGPIAILWSFATSLVIDPLFGLLGGLIGYSVFKPKQPPQVSPPAPPPMIPPSQQS